MRFNSIFDPSLWAVARSWSGAIFSIIVVSVESVGWMRSAAAMCDRVVSMNAPRLIMAVFSSAHFEAREGSCANVSAKSCPSINRFSRMTFDALSAMTSALNFSKASPPSSLMFTARELDDDEGLTKNRRALKTSLVTRSSNGRANSCFCARLSDNPLKLFVQDLRQARVSVLCPLGFIFELEVRLLHQRLVEVQDVGLRLKMYERPTTQNNKDGHASSG